MYSTHHAHKYYAQFRESAASFGFAVAVAFAVAFLAVIPSVARNLLLAREASARSCLYSRYPEASSSGLITNSTTGFSPKVCLPPEPATQPKPTKPALSTPKPTQPQQTKPHPPGTTTPINQLQFN